MSNNKNIKVKKRLMLGQLSFKQIKYKIENTNFKNRLRWVLRRMENEDKECKY